MSKTKNPVTINTIISLADTSEQYVSLLTESTLHSKIDKSEVYSL